MFTRHEIGRIAGIPIFLDMFFVLVLIIFSHRYFTSGDPQMISAGLVIIAGLLVSVLLHELGHAFAGRLFRAEVTHIELTGLGGLAHFERSLPPSVLARTVIFLAGPAANLGLFWLFSWAAGSAEGSGRNALALALAVLSSANLALLIFNLLPAYPLDGGRTLDAWLGVVLGPAWSVRVVGVLGLLISLGLAVLAFPSAFFLMLVAFFLLQSNWSALQSVGWPGGRR